MTQTELTQIARAIVAKGKGILAADESVPTIEKRLQLINLPSTEENRRAYRKMLFSTPGLGEYIGGVILFDETIRQKDQMDILRQQGIIPGIKVDLGVTALPLSPGEKMTEGLDGLAKRLVEYRQLGAQFTKWRAVFSIGENLPTELCIETNAEQLALFAALCQENDLVPIVEPEVLMTGEHSLLQCAEVTERVLHGVFQALYLHHVDFTGMLLKPNMVLHMKDADQVSPQEEAGATLRCLFRTVPAAVPAIVFLSGGQEAISATVHLDALNRLNRTPWTLSFSYGRALETPALLTWKGEEKNVAAAQKVLLHRARCNSLASQGQYTVEAEQTQ